MTGIRRYVISGCQNLRDLGGYEAKGHRITKWHSCYRCDLPLCDSKGWNQLYEELGIRTVIDLRSSAERAYQDNSNKEKRMQFLTIPLLKEGSISNTTSTEEYSDTYKQSMSENYLQIVLSNPEGIVQILMEINFALAKGAVLFHCTAGKDRTGIIAFFLLWLAQVQIADIMADYQVSSTYAYYGNNSTIIVIKELQSFDTAWMHSQPETLGSLFAYFSEHDMKHFLFQNGMPMEAIHELIHQFTYKKQLV